MASCPATVRKMLLRSGFANNHSGKTQVIYVSVRDALIAALQKYPDQLNSFQPTFQV